MYIYIYINIYVRMSYGAGADTGACVVVADVTRTLLWLVARNDIVLHNIYILCYKSGTCRALVM